MLEPTSPLFDRAMFAASLLFLLGLLMVAASMFEGVRVRYPKVMLNGFLLAVLSIVMAVTVAFLA